jgi:hypothetical protein
VLRGPFVSSIPSERPAVLFVLYERVKFWLLLGPLASRGSIWGYGIKKLVIDQRCLAGGGQSAWSAPPKEVDEDPDEAGALLHFTSISRIQARVRGVSKKLHVMKLACLLVLLSRSRPRCGVLGGQGKKLRRTRRRRIRDENYHSPSTQPPTIVVGDLCSGA